MNGDDVKNFAVEDLGVAVQQDFKDSNEPVPTWNNVQPNLPIYRKDLFEHKVECDVNVAPVVTVALSSEGYILVRPTQNNSKAQERVRKDLKELCSGPARSVSIPVCVPNNSRAVVTFGQGDLIVWDVSGNKPYARYSLEQIYNKAFEIEA